MAELVDALALEPVGQPAGVRVPLLAPFREYTVIQFDIEKVSPIEQKLVFNIPADDIKSRLDTAFAHLQGNVRMPGFRQGKAPRKLIERRFGARVRAEVTNNVINDSFKSRQRDGVFRATIRRRQ